VSTPFSLFSDIFSQFICLLSTLRNLSADQSPVAPAQNTDGGLPRLPPVADMTLPLLPGYSRFALQDPPSKEPSHKSHNRRLYKAWKLPPRQSTVRLSSSKQLEPWITTFVSAGLRWFPAANEPCPCYGSCWLLDDVSGEAVGRNLNVQCNRAASSHQLPDLRLRGPIRCLLHRPVADRITVSDVGFIRQLLPAPPS
jgi:hypothetical protein